jgi:hypothetical protein
LTNNYFERKKKKKCATRGRHGPKLIIRKRSKKLSATNFKIPKYFFLYVLKGPFQHTKDLSAHFLISESYSKKGVLTARQKQILGSDLF